MDFKHRYRVRLTRAGRQSLARELARILSDPNRAEVWVDRLESGLVSYPPAIRAHCIVCAHAAVRDLPALRVPRFATATGLTERIRLWDYPISITEVQHHETEQD